MTRLSAKASIAAAAVLAFAGATHAASNGAAGPALPPFLQDNCLDCHDSDSKKGNLDLTALGTKFNLDEWVKIFDRVHDGEMPPPKKKQPDAKAVQAFLDSMSGPIAHADSTRELRDGRSRLRRLNRVELENSLRDLLALPGLRLKEALPEDGKSHGFDTLGAALDTSFVHLESYLAAVDKALNAALCPMVEKPPVLKYRYRPWDSIQHDGKECEGSFALAVGNHTAIGMAGMKLVENCVADTGHHIIDPDGQVTAVGLFRHEDADYRTSLTTIAPVLTGWYRLRVSAYSFGWDGKQVVPTERHGALGWGIHSTGEHFGTVDLPPNAPAEREVTAWLERGGGMTHGTDDHLRLIAASCENFRDYANKRKDVFGPFTDAPGVAVQWVEIEGPLNEQWPPASHHALFGDLAVKEWTPASGVPKPAQQAWPRGNPHALPQDPYGENGQKRQMVYVETKDAAADARRLLGTFLRRAFRRPVSVGEVAFYADKVDARMKEGAAFQDAMLGAYREALTSPEFLLIMEPAGALDDYALASRLSYFLWSSLPDETLNALADRHELSKPAVLHAQVERMLNDPRADRFVTNFLGEWLRLREIGDTQPDKKLYPEFMPWLQEAMLKEAHATFAEMLKSDLGVTRLVKSDFAMINEPLANLYGIDGVRGWDIRKVPLPAESHRGGFLTMAAVLKTTANGTTTSPVKRGAFVMDKLLGIVPTPPPPNAGAIEPDVRGSTTVREQLDKHRSNPTCAGCHKKMDGYGFALESFDVVGEWRGKYRAVGGAGRDEDARKVNGHRIEYHYGLPVDPSGEMPDGQPFTDVDSLRAILAAQPDRLGYAFTSQLVTYATGAEITFADRAEVQKIVAASKSHDYGIRTLVHLITESPLFRNK
ncbi:MAG TPA: DUF1592 domain-containing protein [Chthoniobacter sp.]|nr:DUF1592 domain-containing protein [Chthoniobacter sp.]